MACAALSRRLTNTWVSRPSSASPCRPREVSHQACAVADLVMRHRERGLERRADIDRMQRRSSTAKRPQVTHDGAHALGPHPRVPQPLLERLDHVGGGRSRIAATSRSMSSRLPRTNVSGLFTSWRRPPRACRATPDARRASCPCMRCRSVTSIETLMVPTISPAPSRIGARCVSYVPGPTSARRLVASPASARRAPPRSPAPPGRGRRSTCDEVGLSPESIEPPTLDQGHDARAVARREDHGCVSDDLPQPVFTARVGLLASTSRVMSKKAIATWPIAPSSSTIGLPNART